jgi:hypothetical protein
LRHALANPIDRPVSNAPPSPSGHADAQPSPGEARRAPPTPPASAVVRRGYPLLGLGLLLLYLPTLARGVTFTDGPELVTAVVSLGVAHPTGYPLFILVGHAFCKLLALPILACVKIEVLNALYAAGAAVFTAHTTRALVRLGRPEAPVDADLAGLFAGFMLAIAPLVWEEVRIPEVYAMHLFLVAWAGYAWIRFEVTGRTAYVLGAALPMGIGLAHHVTMVYMLPAAFVYLLVRRPGFFVAWLAFPVVRLVRVFRPRFAAGAPAQPAHDATTPPPRARFEGWWGFPVACLIGFVPLLSYAFLVWANKHSTGVPWGDCNGWDNLYAHFTGRQYQGFMHSLDRAGHITRLIQIAPIFDLQFLPMGTVLFLSGVFFAFRRTWRPALFFLLFLTFNAAHGAHYGVGDYGTYYIPGLYACAIFIGVGLAGVIGIARRRSEASRAVLCFAAIAVMSLGAALSIVLYARLTNRMPAFVARRPVAHAIPFVLGALAAGAAAVRARRRPGWPRPLSARALPATLLAGLATSLVPVAITRAHDFATQPNVGESYGGEVATHLPPGSVLMTQGDGFLFTMWYENHVRGRASEAVTVDLGNVHTPWFQRYAWSHSPVACDPLSPENVKDPVGYASRCDTYEKRMEVKPLASWASFGLAGNRRPFGKSAKPVLRGTDPQCAETKWRDEHIGKECRCWQYGKLSGAAEGVVEEDCVESAEEGGVVPRDPVEIFAQRIIEDMIDERPVFERNVLTQSAAPTANPRGWDGATYQRLSEDFALVSRGRFNQVVWAEDLRRHDACGATFRPLPLRPLIKPRTRPAGPDRRRRYVPNPRPMLLQSTYLVTDPTGHDDDATRELRPGDAAFLHVDWFERFYWDASKPDKHGKPIHHGVRVCVFDPGGRRIASREVVTGTAEPVALLAKGDARAPGTYHVAACTVGELGEEPLPLRDDQRCAFTVLEYDFAVR